MRGLRDNNIHPKIKPIENDGTENEMTSFFYYFFFFFSLHIDIRAIG